MITQTHTHSSGPPELWCRDPIETHQSNQREIAVSHQSRPRHGMLGFDLPCSLWSMLHLLNIEYEETAISSPIWEMFVSVVLYSGLVLPSSGCPWIYYTGSDVKVFDQSPGGSTERYLLWLIFALVMTLHCPPLNCTHWRKGDDFTCT